MGVGTVVPFLKMESICLILLAIIDLGACIKIGEQPTSRMRVTKYSKTTTISAEPVTERSFAVETYKVIASNGAPCIQLTVDALVSIKYNTRLDEREEADMFVHHSPKTEGSCNDGSSQTMSISTKGFTLDWIFAKTGGGEGWFVSSISLTYNTSVPLMKNSAIRGRRVTLGNRSVLFVTPVGKSYTCQRDEIKILLTNLDSSSEVDHEAELMLRQMQLQAFMYKKTGAFGPPYSCDLAGTTRSESAPVAAGAVLAIATAAILCGYAAYRYYKVKKVQYDTMA